MVRHGFYSLDGALSSNATLNKPWELCPNVVDCRTLVCNMQDTSVQHPDHFTFAVVCTDENVAIPLNFGSCKIRLETNDTIALHHLRLNTCDLRNVRDRRQWVTLVFQTGVYVPAVTPAPLTGPRRDDANANVNPRLLGLEPNVERKVMGSGPTQVTTDKIFLPDCKIGTLEELTTVLNFMVYYAKLKFMTLASTGLVH